MSRVPQRSSGLRLQVSLLPLFVVFLAHVAVGLQSQAPAVRARAAAARAAAANADADRQEEASRPHPRRPRLVAGRRGHHAGTVSGAVSAPGGEGEAGAAPGETHHSIFQLHLRSLDNTNFYLILVAMILFCVAVDRLQAYSVYSVRHSPISKLFLDRLNSELLLFGVVAITVFTVENAVGTIPENYHVIVEFVDILCSLGACSLILFALVIFKMLRRNEVWWTMLETEQVDLTAEVLEYQAMADYFRKMNSLSKEFAYHKYLQKALVLNCCEVMNVHWSTWILFVFFPLIGLIERAFRQTPMSDAQFLTLQGCLAWIGLALHLVILCWVHYAHSELDRCLDARSQDHPTKEEQELEKEAHEAWRWSVGRMSRCIHLCSLTVSFQLGFFLMTGIYNATTLGKPLTWLTLVALPLMINMMLLLPIMLTRFVFVQAFFAPDDALIGQVLEEYDQLAEDLRFVRDAWEAREDRNCEELADGLITEKEFKHMLTRYQLHVSGLRATRLFWHLDVKEKGAITTQDFLDAMAQVGPPKQRGNH